MLFLLDVKLSWLELNTWLERSLLVSRLLRSCSRASFLARISSRLVSSPSSSSSPLLCSRTRSISSSSQRFCSSIFYSMGVIKWRITQQENNRYMFICLAVFLWHLLLFQWDDRAVTAAAPLPLEGGDLLRLYSQDLLLLLVLYLQLLQKRYGNNQVHSDWTE